MSSLSEGEQIKQLGDIVPPVAQLDIAIIIFGERKVGSTNRMPESWLSSRNEARIAALSFWMTARSSAIVLAERTFRMNCLTVGDGVH